MTAYATARTTALYRLWAAAARGLELDHLDPRVGVEVYAIQPYRHDTIRIAVEYVGNRSTEDRESPIGRRHGLCARPGTTESEFRLTIPVGSWPGYKHAQATYLGMHLAFLQHEALELVRGGHDGCSWSPHTGLGIYSKAQDAINSSVYSSPYRADFDQASMFWTMVIGTSPVPPSAATEIEAETRWVIEGGEWQ